MRSKSYTVFSSECLLFFEHREGQNYLLNLSSEKRYQDYQFGLDKFDKLYCSSSPVQLSRELARKCAHWSVSMPRGTRARGRTQPSVVFEEGSAEAKHPRNLRRAGEREAATQAVATRQEKKGIASTRGRRGRGKVRSSKKNEVMEVEETPAQNYGRKRRNLAASSEGLVCCLFVSFPDLAWKQMVQVGVIHFICHQTWINMGWIWYLVVRPLQSIGILGPRQQRYLWCFKIYLPKFRNVPHKQTLVNYGVFVWQQFLSSSWPPFLPFSLRWYTDFRWYRCSASW